MWYPGKNLVGGIRQIGHGIMENRRERQGLQNRAMGPQGPAPQNAMAQNYGQDRGAQLGALNAYGQAMTGNAPSLAQAQLMAGRQQGVVDQLGMAAQARGGSLAAQQRQAQGIGAAGAMGLERDMAMQRAAEIEAARAGYAQQANTMAGMSGGAMGQNADLAAQWGLGQRGMDLQALNQRQQFGLGIADRVIGAGLGAGQIAMFSDERLKTDIRPAEDEAADTLASLHGVGYRYKDERHGPTDKETIGIKAQDLQKTPAGRRVVFDVPGEGLAVDMPGSLSLLLAGTSGMEKRLRKLEGRE